MLKKMNLSNNKLKMIPESIGNLISLEELNSRANFWMILPKFIDS